jgi:hypothetical protein
MGCSFGGLGIRGRYPVIPSQNEGGFLLIHSRSKMSTPVLLHHCLRPPILALLSFLFFHPEKVQWVYDFFMKTSTEISLPCQRRFFCGPFSNCPLQGLPRRTLVCLGARSGDDRNGAIFTREMKILVPFFGHLWTFFPLWA